MTDVDAALSDSTVAAATVAVAQACTVCRGVSAGLVGVLEKQDRSPVTVADFASQAVINRHLRDVLGPFPMIAEESSDALREPNNAALLARVVEAVRPVWPDAGRDGVLSAIDAGSGGDTSSGFWTLDPIDGTKGFLRGQQYAISLAYVHEGRPRLGLLGCPHLSRSFDRPFDTADPSGTIYVGREGSGLVELAADEPDAAPTELVAREHTGVQRIRTVASVERAHSHRGQTDEALEQLGVPTEILRLDSQAKYAVVARGQAECYLRLPRDPERREYIWDHAAGAIVASAGGCIVSDIDGKPLDFSHGPTLRQNYGIVCAHPSVHAKLIEAIAKILGETRP